MLLSLNPATDQFRKFILHLPYSVILALPVKDEEDEITDFEFSQFNQQARQDFSGLQYWHSGATMRELFHEEATNGLFSLYKKAFINNTAQKGVYYSTVTKSWRSNLIQPFYGGVLAVGKVRKVPGKTAVKSLGFDMALAQYRAAVYEAYEAYL